MTVDASIANLDEDEIARAGRLHPQGDPGRHRDADRAGRRLGIPGPLLSGSGLAVAVAEFDLAGNGGMAIRVGRTFAGDALRDPGRICALNCDQHSARGRRGLFAAAAEHDLPDPAGVAVDAEGRHCAAAGAVDRLRDAAEDRRGLPGVLLPDHRRDRERPHRRSGLAHGPDPVAVGESRCRRSSRSAFRPPCRTFSSA